VKDSDKDSGITRQQADEILRELKAIRQLLERTPAPSIPSGTQHTVKLRIEGGFTFGSSDAPVTIVEFTDYQCPYCRQFHNTTFAEIRSKFVDTGKVRYVIRDFPLEDMHPNALRAAEAAHCAGDQGLFLRMHDALFTEATNLGEKGLIDRAASLKLDMVTFKSCLSGGKHRSEIHNEMQLGSTLQIDGTPSFLIGKSEGEEVSGMIVFGAQPFSVFESTIKGAETGQ
jgi:protein-disulfide isomerase